MRLEAAVIAIVVLVAMASCTPAGYYDANGVYRAYGKGDSFRYDKPNKPPVATYDAPSSPTTTTIVTYDRQGYYDRNGYYIASDRGPGVPARYFPPRGMCRVWFTGRDVDDQPSIESCQGIQNRVPDGAYVIYGG